MALSDIETIVIVIMENRSFDHMQGYLSLDGIMDIEGLRGRHLRVQTQVDQMILILVGSY